MSSAGEQRELNRFQAFTMAGNGIAIITDRPADLVEVHPPSVNGVNMDGVTVEYYPPAPAVG